MLTRPTFEKGEDVVDCTAAFNYVFLLRLGIYMNASRPSLYSAVAHVFALFTPPLEGGSRHTNLNFVE